MAFTRQISPVPVWSWFFHFLTPSGSDFTFVAKAVARILATSQTTSWAIVMLPIFPTDTVLPPFAVDCKLGLSASVNLRKA
jgi:hypothetical protein